jgi:hypothetical protein
MGCVVNGLVKHENDIGIAGGGAAVFSEKGKV